MTKKSKKNKPEQVEQVEQTLVVFEEPPSTPGARRVFEWRRIAAELRAAPGRWALVVKDGDSSMVTRIRYGQINAFLPGHYQAKSSRVSPTSIDIYARYVGPPASRFTSDGEPLDTPA